MNPQQDAHEDNKKKGVVVKIEHAKPREHAAASKDAGAQEADGLRSQGAVGVVSPAGPAPDSKSRAQKEEPTRYDAMQIAGRDRLPGYGDARSTAAKRDNSDLHEIPAPKEAPKAIVAKPTKAPVGKPAEAFAAPTGSASQTAAPAVNTAWVGPPVPRSDVSLKTPADAPQAKEAEGGALDAKLEARNAIAPATKDAPTGKSFAPSANGGHVVAAPAKNAPPLKGETKPAEPDAGHASRDEDQELQHSAEDADAEEQEDADDEEDSDQPSKRGDKGLQGEAMDQDDDS